MIALKKRTIEPDPYLNVLLTEHDNLDGPDPTRTVEITYLPSSLKKGSTIFISNPLTSELKTVKIIRPPSGLKNGPGDNIGFRIDFEPGGQMVPIGLGEPISQKIKVPA